MVYRTVASKIGRTPLIDHRAGDLFVKSAERMSRASARSEAGVCRLRSSRMAVARVQRAVSLAHHTPIFSVLTARVGQARVCKRRLRVRPTAVGHRPVRQPVLTSRRSEGATRSVNICPAIRLARSEVLAPERGRNSVRCTKQVSQCVVYRLTLWHVAIQTVDQFFRPRARSAHRAHSTVASHDDFPVRTIQRPGTVPQSAHPIERITRGDRMTFARAKSRSRLSLVPLDATLT
jgi:hypothetical protein